MCCCVVQDLIRLCNCSTRMPFQLLRGDALLNLKKVLFCVVLFLVSKKFFYSFRLRLSFVSVFVSCSIQKRRRRTSRPPLSSVRFYGFVGSFVCCDHKTRLHIVVSVFRCVLCCFQRALLI